MSLAIILNIWGNWVWLLENSIICIGRHPSGNSDFEFIVRANFLWISVWPLPNSFFCNRRHSCKNHDTFNTNGQSYVILNILGYCLAEVSDFIWFQFFIGIWLFFTDFDKMLSSFLKLIIWVTTTCPESEENFNTVSFDFTTLH